MKLLIDLSTFEKVHKGGKDEVAYNLLRGFAKLGYTPNIVCVARQELVSIIHEIDPGYIVIPRERKFYSGRIGNLLSPVTDYFYGKEIKKIVREKECDCILYTNKRSPIIKQSVKTFLIPHDIQILKVLEETSDLKLYTRGLAFWLKVSFKYCNTIVAISDFDRNEMIRFLPKYKNKIIRIYDPIRFKSVKPSPERINITAINIQHNHKNIITLVKAFAQIAPDIKETLVLVGKRNDETEKEEEIHKIIRENQLSERVRFTGFVTEDELETIIANTRIFVNPSLFEGFGMAAVEMMESRVPTIVANNTAQKETTFGMCRYYEPTTDERALAEAILEELNHPTTESELERIARAIRLKYDYIEIAKEYWNTIMLKLSQEQN